MSSSVVLVPGAPALVPALAGSAAAETAPVVEAACRALHEAGTGHSAVRVFGHAPESRRFGDVRSSLVRWGADLPVGRRDGTPEGPHRLSDSAVVGWWLLDRAGVDLPRAFSGVPGQEFAPAPPGEDELVVVVADGPASLTARAPVPHDPRGVALDSALAAWLARGGALPDPGEAVADEVGWWSRPAWLVLADLVGGRPAEQVFSAAPFGVGYHVAHWPAATVRTPGGAAAGPGAGAGR